MDDHKKLEFVHKMTKTALEHVQHFDVGGVSSPQPNTTPPSNNSPLGNINQSLGLNDNFQSGAAPTTAGTDAAQLNGAYSGVQRGLQQQQDLATQTQPGLTQGLGTQGALSTQLSQQALGLGPNPAQSALNQATGQNISQQAALQASQRGGSSNVGAIAGRAANQGAQTQQQAIGQAATLQAQQQLAAQQEEANLASQQIGQGATAVQNVNQQQQNEQNILQGANTSYNNALVGQQSNINNVNAQTAAGNQSANGNLFGGILQAAGTVAAFLNKGGMVKMDKGGNVLNAEERKKIPAKDFALEGSRYPIHDENHAKNALARVSQNGTPQEKAKVQAAVKKKYPKMGAKKMADGGEIENSDTPKFQATPSTVSAGPDVQQNAVKKDSPLEGLHKVLDPGGFFPANSLAKGGPVQGGNFIPPANLAPQMSGAPKSSVGQWLNSTPMVSNPVLDPTRGAPAGAASLADSLSGIGPGDKSSTPYTDENYEMPELGDSAVGSGPQYGLGVEGVSPSSGGSSYGLGMDYEAKGGKLAAKGGPVQTDDPKQQAEVSGDSLKNDKIPAMLSAGEVVIDRATLADKGPIGQMARALAAHIQKRNGGKK